MLAAARASSKRVRGWRPRLVRSPHKPSQGARRLPVQPWEAELPQVDKVKLTVQGTTPVDTAARQALAFQVLADYVQVLSGQDGMWLMSNPMLPGHAEFATFIGARQDADKQRVQFGGPAAGAPPTEDARQAVLTAFLPKPSVDNYWRQVRGRASQAGRRRAGRTGAGRSPGARGGHGAGPVVGGQGQSARAACER